MSFNLDNYEDVDSRLHKFWEHNVGGRIETEIVDMHRNADGQLDQIIVKATIWGALHWATDGKNGITNYIVASGYAEERLTNYGVNKTSMVENCETSAIGRALANAGYSSKGNRASRQEMEKVERSETVVAGRSATAYRTGAKDTRPTDKQKAYALKLLAGRDWLTEEFRTEKNIEGTLDREQTAEFISWLQERPVTAADINRKNEPLMAQPHDIETGGW